MATSGDDFAEALAGRRAIPTSIFKLLLALLGAQLGPFDDFVKNLWFLSANFRLFTARSSSS